jgi:hypothetical protein
VAERTFRLAGTEQFDRAASILAWESRPRSTGDTPAPAGPNPETVARVDRVTLGREGWRSLSRLAPGQEMEYHTPEGDGHLEVTEAGIKTTAARRGGDTVGRDFQDHEAHEAIEHIESVATGGYVAVKRRPRDGVPITVLARRTFTVAGIVEEGASATA